MKKAYIAFTSLFLAAGAMLCGTASARHLVLYEKFTNVGCGPCARFAVPSDSMLTMRLGDVVAVTYHGNYPYANDEYYIPVKPQIDTRIQRYAVTGYPTVILDGNEIATSVPAIEQRIDQLIKEEQTIDLRLSTSVKKGVLTVKADATPIVALSNPNIRLFVAAIEEEIILDRPALNGQMQFHNEFRQFVGGEEGILLGDFSIAGKTESWQGQWTIEGYSDTDQLAVVAWLQDISTSKVYETAYAPRTTDATEAAKVLLVKDTPTEICTPYYTSKVIFRNTGSNPITSCNVCVEINGKVQKTPWQGELAYLETATFDTPPFTDFEFDAEAEKNHTQFYISDINGTDACSIPYSLDFSNSIVGKRQIEVQLFTDNKPEETSWTVYNASGDVIEVSEAFTERRKFYKKVLELPGDGCYRLTFTDKGGDGIKGAFGNGYYKISQIGADGKTKMIRQADFTGAEHSVFFRLEDAIQSGITAAGTDSADPISFDASAKSVALTAAGNAAVHVTDMSGRILLSAGFNGSEVISLSELPKGVYIVTLFSEGSSVSRSIAL